MKAVNIVKPGQVEIREIEKPVPEEGEAVIKLLYGGICGSDLGSYKGTYAYVDYPRIPGHELSAEIVEIDENHPYLKKGMVVTVNPYINCGHCYSCRRGMVNCCEDNHTLGCQIDGAFREYFTISQERLYDGKGIDPRELALVEPYCIGAHGVKRANVCADDKVLIVGAGTIGVMALIAAKRCGATVYMADISEKKLERAKNFGSDGSILNDESFLDGVREATDGNGFDVVLECVGMPSTFQACIDACAFGARFVLVGIAKESLNFDFTVIQKKELNIFGSRNALKDDFLQAIDDIKDGKLQLSEVVTNEYYYEDAAKAFEDFKLHQDDMLKVVLRF